MQRTPKISPDKSATPPQSIEMEPIPDDDALVSIPLTDAVKDDHNSEDDIELDDLGKGNVYLFDARPDPLKEARLAVDEEFEKRLRALRSTTWQSNDLKRLQEVRKIKELKKKFNSVADQIETFDLQAQVKYVDEDRKLLTPASTTRVNQSLNEMRTAIRDLDNGLLSCPQKILVKIVSFFSAAIAGGGMMIAGAIAGTKIGALLSLPSVTVSGPIGPAVTASVGAAVGGGAGLLAGLSVGAEVGASVTTWGLFKWDPLKNKIRQFDRLAGKKVDEEEEQARGGYFQRLRNKFYCG